MNLKLKISMMGSWFKIVAVLLFVAMLGSSCSRDKDIALNEGGIRINLKGISEYTDGNKLGKLASVNNAQLMNEPVELQSLGDVDLLVTSNLATTSSNHVLDKQATTSPSVPKTSNIGADVKYIIAFYKQPSNELASHYVVTGVEQPVIHLDDGSYKWVAFSFNSSDDMVYDDLVTNDHKLLPATIANKDLIYTSGSLVADGTDKYIDLLFERKTSKIDFKIDVRGMFGKIAKTTAVSLKMYDGQTSTLVEAEVPTFNLLTGATTMDGTEVAPLSSSNLTDVYKDQTVMQVSFHVYPQHIKVGNTITNASIPANSLHFSVPTLDVNLDTYISMYDGAEKTPKRTYTNLDVPMKHGAAPFKLGYRHEIQANLVESAIQAGGVQWARSNLWYDYAATGANKYRFRVHPHQRAKGTEATSDYWNYGAATPDGAYVQGNGVDPCTLVYPQGLWRMPKITEFQKFDAYMKHYEKFLQNEPQPQYLVRKATKESEAVLRSNDLMVPEFIARKFTQDDQVPVDFKTFNKGELHIMSLDGNNYHLPWIQVAPFYQWEENPLQVMLRLTPKPTNGVAQYNGNQEDVIANSDMNALYFPLLGKYRPEGNSGKVLARSAFRKATKTTVADSAAYVNSLEAYYRRDSKLVIDNKTYNVFDSIKYKNVPNIATLNNVTGFGYYYALGANGEFKSGTSSDYFDFYSMYVTDNKLSSNFFSTLSSDYVMQSKVVELKAGSAYNPGEETYEMSPYISDRMMIRCVRNTAYTKPAQ